MPNGNIRYQLKTPYRDGTTHVAAPAHPCARGISASVHVIFEPLDFIARLAALAPKTLALLAGWALPKPRVNLTRFHGVFAPNSKHRALVTPGKRGKGHKPKANAEGQEQTPAERRASMTWAQRLKRVFNIDIETCRACGGAVKVIACIEDPVVIENILTHLQEKGTPEPAGLRPASRAPPADPFG